MSDVSNTWMYNSTWGIRYWNGRFHIHLMWMHWKTGHWNSNRTVRGSYKTLEGALKSFDRYAPGSVVIIFPV